MEQSVKGGNQVNNDKLKEIFNCQFKIWSVGRTLNTDESTRLWNLLEPLMDNVRLDLLMDITEQNHAEELGTYDFDGISESVFSKINELKSKI